LVVLVAVFFPPSTGRPWGPGCVFQAVGTAYASFFGASVADYVVLAGDCEFAADPLHIIREGESYAGLSLSLSVFPPSCFWALLSLVTHQPYPYGRGVSLKSTFLRRALRLLHSSRCPDVRHRFSSPARSAQGLEVSLGSNLDILLFANRRIPNWRTVVANAHVLLPIPQI
jgi:hypothetical protein